MAWPDSEARMNDAVFTRYARACTYVPLAGDAFSLRYILRAPDLQQPSAPGYFANIEVIQAELGVVPVRGDQVEIEDVRYLVNKVVELPFHNPLLALHRMRDAV
jgi:hypothetical protein